MVESNKLISLYPLSYWTQAVIVPIHKGVFIDRNQEETISKMWEVQGGFMSGRV